MSLMLSEDFSPPACGGIQGGTKGHFTSYFALSFYMNQKRLALIRWDQET